ncbi:MAG TPA: ATP-dependent Clp protease proteolytic subunit [Ilumatobacteraceae bacterium]|nr:ATP-dependent Clp protease proteolytic subunit [Ilumatobacteraceae bacterium]
MQRFPHATVFDRLVEQRVLFLADEVTDESASRLIAELLVLSADDPRSDITLLINSPGGSVHAGLALYDVMQLIPNDVATVAVGFAASMGQVLLCAGAAGKRFALPNAKVLMHEGSAGLGGAAADVEIQAASLLRTLERMRSIVARHTGRSFDEITADIGRDRWFDADEARDYGFIDHVVSSLGEIRPVAATRRIGLGSASTVMVP